MIHLMNGSASVIPTTTSLSAQSQDAWDFETSCKVLDGVLTRAGFTFKAKDKAKGRHFILENCPYYDDYDDTDGQPGECAVIVRRDGTFAARCEHDEEVGWDKAFKRAIDWDDHVGEVLDDLGIAWCPMHYRGTPGGIVYYKPGRNGTTRVQLTNFTARIVKDVEEHDGVETRHVFEMDATLNGHTKRFSISAQEFKAMNWAVEHLGAQALVYAGGSKDHARVAIQMLSGNIPTESVYTHLGWLQRGTHHVYLHGDGAIGPEDDMDRLAEQGLRVRLPKDLAGYRLPKPNMGQRLIDGIQDALKLLKVAPHRLTIPLFASVWRAVLGGTDFGLFLVGTTGAGKSELASLIQRFWGKSMDARHLPASWTGTANANEAIAFHAKDALLVVDDFAPTGSASERNSLHQVADRLLRSQGNSSGRARLGADSSLRAAKPPRGLILATGEEIPRGESLRARLAVLEIAPDDMDWERLTRCQRDAEDGRYALVLAGFIRWLAGQYDEVQVEMRQRVRELREAATTSGQHKRTPGIIADLYYGLGLFARFAVEVDAISRKRADRLLEMGWNALGEIASDQNVIQSESDPAQRFLALLRSALASGKAHVAGAQGGHPSLKPEIWGWRKQGDDCQPRGAQVGWVDGRSLYLEPEAAYAVVHDLARLSGEPLAVANKTLHKRLAEKRLLASTDVKRQRLLVRRTLDGQQRNVLHLSADVLGPGRDGRKASPP